MLFNNTKPTYTATVVVVIVGFVSSEFFTFSHFFTAWFVTCSFLNRDGFVRHVCYANVRVLHFQALSTLLDYCWTDDCN